MPELFEQNLKQVIETGNPQVQGGLVEMGSLKKFGSGPQANSYEMGSRNAMEALNSLQGSFKKPIKEEAEEDPSPPPQ